MKLRIANCELRIGERRVLRSFEIRNSKFEISHRASILVGLLWCVVLLSLVVVSVLHTARMDLMVQKNYGDRVQAHYLAVAGIEKAKALLYQNARERSRSGKNHTGELYNSSERFREVAFGRGQFSILRRARQDEGGGIAFGVSDEESRLNINTTESETFTKLEGLTPQIFAAITDWRDGDNAVSPGGAEAEFYLSLQPPYRPRNGPFQSVRELLMVKGISSDLLLGMDTHQNEMLNLAGEGEGNSSRADTLAADVNTGWAASLTVNSAVNNVSAAGTDRVNVQTADETALTGVQGITPAIARAIVSYRGQHAFQNISDLLDVTQTSGNQNQNQNQNSGGGNNRGSQPSSGDSSGPKLINETLLMDIGDDVTTASDKQQAGLININTASLTVLSCLPGVDRDLAQAIISYRQSNGFFPNIAWLLKVPGMSQPILKQFALLVCARSETFRILSEGKINSTGARQRIQAVVHIGLDDVATLSYREDDL